MADEAAAPLSEYPPFNLYVALGLTKSAEQSEIRRAYLAAARALHPDVAPRRDADDDAQAGAPAGDGDAAPSHEQFVRMQAAYEVLGDVQRREAYDAHLKRASCEGVCVAVSRLCLDLSLSPLYPTHSHLFTRPA